MIRRFIFLLKSKSKLSRDLSGVAEVGALGPPFEQAIGPAAKLVGDEHRDEVDRGHVFALGLEEATLEDRGHAAQAQLLESAVELNEVHRDSPWSCG